MIKQRKQVFSTKHYIVKNVKSKGEDVHLDASFGHVLTTSQEAWSNMSSHSGEMQFSYNIPLRASEFVMPPKHRKKRCN